MLILKIDEYEFFDQETSCFDSIKAQTIALEHSLVSLAKWESKWAVPFLDKETEKTPEMMKDYIRCMTLTQNVDPRVYDVIAIHKKYTDAINEYIDAPMTATWFNERKKPGVNKEIVTNELIYYWMIALNIPFECQKWHLNRLLTLIRVCNIKNTPPEKIPKNEWANMQTKLNAQRIAERAKQKGK